MPYILLQTLLLTLFCLLAGASHAHNVREVAPSPFYAAGFYTAGFYTAGFYTAGFYTAGFYTAGFYAAGPTYSAAYGIGSTIGTTSLNLLAHYPTAPSANPFSNVGLDPDKVITQYLHDVWQIEDGLPQSTIKAIQQTRDGYLWFGTEEGLVRYNGVDFLVFDRSNSEVFNTSQDVRALLVDRAGVLWIGTSGGLISISKDQQFASVDETNGLTGKVINALSEDDEGTIWIGTADAGLFSCNAGRCSGQDLGVPSGTTIIRTLLMDKSGTLWIGTDAGLRYIPRGFASGSLEVDGLSNQFVLSIYEDATKGLWIGTREGLFCKNDEAVKQIDLPPSMPEEGVWSLWQDDAQSLWIGLGQSGLVRIHNQEYEYFPVDDGLSHGRVLSLFEDREGSLWIGTEGGGLNRLRSGAFTTFTEQEGLSSNAVLTVYEQPGEGLWIGTEGGGLNRLADGQFTHFDTDAGLSNEVVTSIASAGEDGLWVGTLGGGLNLYQDGSFRAYTEADGLPSETIYSLYEGSAGKIWIGTDKGLGIIEEAGISSYSVDDGLPSNFITAILQDRDGVLWVGTYDAGLVRYEQGAFSVAATEADLGSSIVLSLHEDRDGTLWIGTYGGGLSKYEDGEISRYSTQNGFFDDNVFQILEDDYGALWMGCNKGVFRVEKEDLEKSATSDIGPITVVAFDQNDGLKSREINGGVQPAGWKDQRGRLWFPTIKGVTVVDPAKLNLETPPPVIIERVIADHERRNVEATLVLEPGADKIEFEFAALTFVAGDKVQYRYRLDGLEDNWSEISTHRKASYTNLDPGNYTFQVIAQNSNGVWNREGAQFAFRLKPFYYQSPLFWILSVLGVGLVGYWGNHMNVRRLKYQQQRLQMAVEDRTRNLQEAKDKIEMQATELLAALRDKEVLMQEVHHRVKNNLQVITSLLALQSDRVKDEETAALFQECRHRIQSMAMIHEQLYQSDDLAQIDIRGYLQSISNELARSYNAPVRKIEVEVDADAGHLGVDRAIPCGLIVNELVSNALKHAFPKAQAGKITIQFSTEKDKHLLSVRDNGIGLPEGLDIDKSKTLGMKLIATLVRKLKANMHVCRDKGLFVEIQIPAVRS